MGRRRSWHDELPLLFWSFVDLLEDALPFIIVVGVFIVIYLVFAPQLFRSIAEQHEEYEQTMTGTVTSRYIDGDRYYVEVENDGHKAEHEVALSEYLSADVGSDFPVKVKNKYIARALLSEKDGYSDT